VCELSPADQLCDEVIATLMSFGDDMSFVRGVVSGDLSVHLVELPHNPGARRFPVATIGRQPPHLLDEFR